MYMFQRGGRIDQSRLQFRFLTLFVDILPHLSYIYLNMTLLLSGPSSPRSQPLPPVCQCPAVSPPDRPALCRERVFVFESCQKVKRVRTPAHGRPNSKQVRGNGTLPSAPLIGSWSNM